GFDWGGTRRAGDVGVFLHGDAVGRLGTLRPAARAAEQARERAEVDVEHGDLVLRVEAACSGHADTRARAAARELEGERELTARDLRRLGEGVLNSRAVVGRPLRRGEPNRRRGAGDGHEGQDEDLELELGNAHQYFLSWGCHVVIVTGFHSRAGRPSTMRTTVCFM